MTVAPPVVEATFAHAGARHVACVYAGETQFALVVYALGTEPVWVADGWLTDGRWQYHTGDRATWRAALRTIGGL